MKRIFFLSNSPKRQMIVYREILTTFKFGEMARNVGGGFNLAVFKFGESLKFCAYQTLGPTNNSHPKVINYFCDTTYINALPVDPRR